VTDDLALIANDPDAEAPGRPSENAAVVRCIRAFQRAYKKVLDELGKSASDYPAEKAGREAYLRALPPLSGYENIRDFIACIAYADLTELIRHSDAEHFLDSAKVALAAIRYQPKRLDIPPKPLGRPPKFVPAQKNK
jgi:hypothetical protein